MFRYLAFSGCLALSLIVSSSQTLSAHDAAQEVFENCNRELAKITRACVEHSESTFKRCAPQIREHLANGDRESAQELARRCIQHIHTQVERCDNAIKELCKRCVRRLHALGAERLARRFRENCGKSRRTIHEAGNRAIHGIQNLFD